jgi:hypothetical protein
LAHCAGSGTPAQRLQLEDKQDFSGVRFMESYESRHSDFEFTGRLAAALGVTQPPLRIDSQAKYGARTRLRMLSSCAIVPASSTACCTLQPAVRRGTSSMGQRVAV